MNSSETSTVQEKTQLATTQKSGQVISFKKVSFDDKEWIKERLEESNYMGCEYCFSNIYLWGSAFEFEIANHKGFLLIKAVVDGEVIHYFPAGSGNLHQVIEDLIIDSQLNGETLVFGNVTDEHTPQIKKYFPNTFEYMEIRDSSDYIYLREKMVSLAGKKLHAKRNHINRFKDNPDWSFELITKENITECYGMSIVWTLKHFGGNTHDSDFCAMQKSFDYFDELDLMGGLIRQNGEVVAFTMGTFLNTNTFVIHIEKAFHEIQGAYPMINQQFAMRLPEHIKYINREEDLGQEGLRRSKLSYYPEILLAKSTATHIGEPL